MFSKNTLLLDLGSYEIKAIVVNEKNQIIARKVQSSNGIINGYVNNAHLFQTCMLNLLKKIRRDSKIKIENTILLIGGKLLEYKILSSNEIAIHGVIDHEKVKLIEQRLKTWTTNNKSILLKFFPVEFLIDKLQVENPFGLHADIIKFKYFLCYAPMNQLNSTVYLLEKLNLNVIDILPSLFELSNLNLSEDEKKLGSLLFDIGSHNINWTFYYQGIPMNAGTINLGSEIITNKIAKSLKISLEQANKIKHEYAYAFLKPEHFCSWVKLVKDNNEEFILQSEMIRKILPEINLIINEIKKILDQFSNQKAYTAVFCGNGSLLNGLSEHLQKLTSIHIKNTKQDNFLDLTIQEKHTQITQQKSMVKKIINFIKNIFD